LGLEDRGVDHVEPAVEEELSWSKGLEVTSSCGIDAVVPVLAAARD
jgi:hypothetical protein